MSSRKSMALLSGSVRDRGPVGEASRVVAAYARVLEQSVAIRAVAGGSRDVVADAPWNAAGDVRVGQVEGGVRRPVASAPLPVRPVGVAAVPAADVQRHKAERLHLDQQRVAGLGG